MSSQNHLHGGAPTQAAARATAKGANPPRRIGVSTVALLTAAAVVTSLRGLPTMARTEMTMFVYLGFSIILFLIPGALVSAELGGMFSGSEGGVYRWLGEAFHERWGFMAQWLQWIQNVVWYPTGITFIAAAFAFVIGRNGLAGNNYYIGLFVIVFYWLATLIVLPGLGFFARIANWAFVIGTVIPGIVLLGIFLYWVGSGHPIGWEGSIPASLRSGTGPSFWPSFSGLGSVAFLAGFILLFAGVETQAVHVRDMERPQRYSSAVLLGSALVAVIFIAGSLAVAGLVPYKNLSLVAADFTAFQMVFGGVLHVGWIARIMDLLIGIGGVSGVLAWLGGPPRGMLATSRDGWLPPIFQRVNRHNMPVGILVPQGILVTIIACIYFVMKDVSVGFYLISAMTVALYLLMYLLMYPAALWLRHSRPDLPRPFRVPGGGVGMWVAVVVGFVGVAFAFVVSFFPPTLLPIGTPTLYVSLVVAGTVVLGGLPLILYQTRQERWKNKSVVESK